MFNIIHRFYPKNYRMINYIFCRNKIKYPSDINNIFIKSNKGSFKINHKSVFPTDIKNLFFMSKIDIPKVNHKSSTIKNKETEQSQNFNLTDCEKYYNQNYDIKKKYPSLFEW
jgi:hypothetical protein